MSDQPSAPIRSGRFHRIASTLGVAALAATGLTTALAPTAHAEPVTYGVHCVPPSIGGSPFDTDAKVDLSISPEKPVYSVGDKLTVTWTWKDAAKNPSSITVGKDKVKPSGTVVVSGSQGGEIAMSGPQQNAETPGGEKLWLSTMTGSFTVGKPGAISFSPGSYSSVANMFGSWETPCATTGKPGVSTSISVNGAVKPATLRTSRSPVKANSPVELTGEDWPAGSGAPALTLCTADLKNCDPKKLTGSTVKVDGNGVLSGKVSAAAGTADGTYVVKATLGTSSAFTGLQVDAKAPAWAENVDFGVKCRALPGNGTFDWTAGATLEVSPAKPFYKVGEKVTVTWKWTKYPRNPQPLWIVLLADTVTPAGTVKVSGAQTGTVAMSGPKKNPATGERAPVQVESMTGTLTVAKEGRIDLAPADYNLSLIVQNSACNPVGNPAVSTSITGGEPAPRKLTAAPAAGPVNTETTLTGSGFTPGAEVRLDGVDKDWAGTGDSAKVTAGADGKFSAKFKVTKLNTERITATEAYDGSKSADTLFTVERGNGTLTMSAAEGGVDLSSITADGKPGEMTGALRTVTVQDGRGSTLGWTVSGTITDLVSDHGGKIPADKVTWTPACTANADAVGRVTPGAPGPIVGATLCTVAASSDPGTPTGGTFTADAKVSVAVPAYQKAGSYTATLTLTLS